MRTNVRETKCDLQGRIRWIGVAHRSTNMLFILDSLLALDCSIDGRLTPPPSFDNLRSPNAQSSPFVGTGSLANGDRAKEPTGDAPAQAEKEPSDDSDEIVDGSAAERLQAAEALYSLARSGGGGVNDGGNARSAALAAVGGGGIQTQGERLTKAAEFFLEMGFFAPADGGRLSEHCIFQPSR